MSAETIAEVLAAHQIDRGHRDTRVHCLCGWESGPGLPFRADVHLAHVAAALKPVIREREKAAWDAGKDAALKQADWEYGAANRQYIATNPYDTKEEA